MLTLGGNEECDIVLKGEGIKAFHASLEENGGAFWISGLSRLTPIYVNEKRVRREVLRHQDILRIGEQSLRFSLYDDLHLERKDGEERLEAYQRVYLFSQRVTEQLRSSELFEVILEEIVTLTHADQGVLVSLSGGERHVRATVDRMTYMEVEDDRSIEISQSVIDQVIKSRESLRVNDLLSGGEFEESRSIMEMGLCSVMCAPLIIQGELLGVIYVGSYHPLRTFEDHDLKSLCVFSSQAAMLLKIATIQGQLVEDNTRLRQELERAHFGSLIGASDAMISVFDKVDRLSKTSVNILLSGETGTGKELIAREIHTRSARKDQAFVSVNCGALPEGLIESELFGHKSGAFTDAIKDKQGCFEAAHGGTLFLDEIGELPLHLQVKLLRAIAERQVVPVGTTHPISVDIRLISATNVNLSEAVERGAFRSDLFYRLQTVEIELPPLRERGRDVLLIARYLIDRFSERYQRPVRRLSAEAQRGLCRYSWPGNIRELENRLSQAVILSEGPELSLNDLNLHPELLTTSILTLKEAKDRFTQDYVQHALALNHGNRNQTARDLDVDPRTIYRYLREAKREELSQ